MCQLEQEAAFGNYFGNKAVVFPQSHIKPLTMAEEVSKLGHVMV